MSVATRGLTGGLVFGLAAVAWLQIGPSLNLPPACVLTGAPQGDQYIYMAMVRAIWRGPNAISRSTVVSTIWSSGS